MGADQCNAAWGICGSFVGQQISDFECVVWQDSSMSFDVAEGVKRRLVNVMRGTFACGSRDDSEKQATAKARCRG
jgi:hypothetical protein